MKKLTGMLLILCCLNAFAEQLYVKKEENGDIIYSNSPIPEKPKPAMTPEKKELVSPVAKKN